MSKQKQSQSWHSDVVNWSDITEKTASLMIEQSSAVLKETVSTDILLSSRCDKLLTILLSSATGLMVYLNSVALSDIYKFLPMAAEISFIPILIGLIFCFKNLRKYTICVPGEEPKNIVTSKMLDTFKNNNQYLNMAVCICENIQVRIDENRTLNNRRSKNNTIALYALITIPALCPVISLLLSRLMTNCF